MTQKLEYRVETHRLAAPFRISGYVFEGSDVVVVELFDGEHRGRGEAGGVYYLGDEAPQIVELLEANRAAIEACGSREELRQMLPPGGARNAVDCALWELEALRSGAPAYRLAGIDAPRPLITTFTLGADEPSKMAEGARNYVGAKAIKIKLTGEFRARHRAGSSDPRGTARRLVGSGRQSGLRQVGSRRHWFRPWRGRKSR